MSTYARYYFELREISDKALQTIKLPPLSQKDAKKIEVSLASSRAESNPLFYQVSSTGTGKHIFAQLYPEGRVPEEEKRKTRKIETI